MGAFVLGLSSQIEAQYLGTSSCKGFVGEYEKWGERDRRGGKWDGVMEAVLLYKLCVK